MNMKLLNMKNDIYKPIKHEIIINFHLNAEIIERLIFKFK